MARPHLPAEAIAGRLAVVQPAGRVGLLVEFIGNQRARAQGRVPAQEILGAGMDAAVAEHAVEIVHVAADALAEAAEAPAHACRPALQRADGAGEIVGGAVLHAERREDFIRHEIDEGPSRGPRDDLAQQDIAGVAVLEPVARRETRRRAMLHEQSDHVRGGEGHVGIPIPVGQPHMVRQPGRVVQQMPDGDAAVGCKLWNVVRQRVVDAELSPLSQHHDAEPRERLRHRRQRERCVARQRNRGPRRRQTRSGARAGCFPLLRSARCR